MPENAATLIPQPLRLASVRRHQRVRRQGDSLRAELILEATGDSAWAIANPETHELLVRTADYTLDQYEQWVATTLSAALLGPA